VFENINETNDVNKKNLIMILILYLIFSKKQYLNKI
jgi:hypothetical protein